MKQEEQENVDRMINIWNSSMENIPTKIRLDEWIGDTYRHLFDEIFPVEEESNVNFQ